MQMASLGVSTGHVSKQGIRPLREMRPMCQSALRRWTEGSAKSAKHCLNPRAALLCSIGLYRDPRVGILCHL